MESRRELREYHLAEMIIHLQDALKTANENAHKHGMLGVLPQTTSPTFRNAAKFHARVRKLLKESV